MDFQSVSHRPRALLVPILRTWALSWRPPLVFGQAGASCRPLMCRVCLADIEHVLDERSELADRRDTLADERERLADERDRIADERERLADFRDQIADRRDADAAARERRLLVWEGHDVDAGVVNVVLA
jgi:hypothetical protein